MNALKDIILLFKFRFLVQTNFSQNGKNIVSTRLAGVEIELNLLESFYFMFAFQIWFAFLNWSSVNWDWFLHWVSIEWGVLYLRRLVARGRGPILWTLTLCCSRNRGGCGVFLGRWGRLVARSCMFRFRCLIFQANRTKYTNVLN